MAISQGNEGQGSLFTQINITPLTDIFLVLLIIMMVIAPMFQSTNQEIQVPGLNSGQALEDNQVTVEIGKAGELYLKGARVSPGALSAQLSELSAGLTDKHLVVRADQATRGSEVIKVFEAASLAGFEKLTIAGEPLNAARQEELRSQEASGSDSIPEKSEDLP